MEFLQNQLLEVLSSIRGVTPGSFQGGKLDHVWQIRLTNGIRFLFTSFASHNVAGFKSQGYRLWERERCSPTGPCHCREGPRSRRHGSFSKRRGHG
jgi:hypothetical protein